MMTIGALGLVMVLAGLGNGQAGNSAKLRVNGVGLDSSYAQVVKALGKPAIDGKASAEECAGGREKTVEYAGLSWYFMDGDSKNRKTFRAVSFEVTSGNWVVSGVKIGDSATMVRAKFGRRYKVGKDDVTGETVWDYDMGETNGPGTTRVNFRGGRVSGLSSSYTVC